jgi:CHAP domain
VSVETVIARIAELQRALQPPAPVSATPGATSAATTSFAGALGQATATASAASVAPTGLASGGSAGQRMVALAEGEIGQTEQPPGSNDSPRIAEYRTATAGSGIGPWCNYFVSWLAKQAGSPLGEQGQGFGAVSATWDWAQRTGRALPAGSTPQPGDLIVWGGRHIGIVESVLPDGRIQTIEGNSSNAVSRRVHGPDGDGATGYVRVG